MVQHTCLGIATAIGWKVSVLQSRSVKFLFSGVLGSEGGAW